jgi:hypothetical protein
MPSYSTNLNLAKPTVGGDTNQWGGYLNTNTDTLDGIFNAAGTGTSVGLQVGSGKTLKVGGTLTATGTIQLTGSQNELRFFEAIGGADNYVALKAPNEMSGNNNYSLVLPAAQGTAGQFLKLTSLSGSEGLLQFADAGGQADNYFASSGLANKDLGVGLHLKIGDSGASVLSGADELVIENSSSAGLSILSHHEASGIIAFGDSADNDVGKIEYDHNDDNLYFTSGSQILFKTAGSNRLTINSGGDLKINSALSGLNSQVVLGFGATTKGMLMYDYNSGSGTTFIQFRNGATAATTLGEITRNSSNNAINYNTTSDYRLKTNIEEKTDGIEKIKQLKVKKFNWKSNVDDNKVDGFIAHEVSDVVPEAITGIKDATETYKDEDGNNQTRIIPQGIDQAKLVPLITAALQEAITKIESLESEIDQLKGVN